MLALLEAPSAGFIHPPLGVIQASRLEENDLGITSRSTFEQTDLAAPTAAPCDGCWSCLVAGNVHTYDRVANAVRDLPRRRDGSTGWVDTSVWDILVRC